MSERIDGVLSGLNSSLSVDRITVFPLLSLLEFHAGHIGNQRTEIIGGDSTDGRTKSIEIISDVISDLDGNPPQGVSGWLHDALGPKPSGSLSRELIINLYEEISGILTASGVSSDDQDAIKRYISSTREDWMPPFDSAADRIFVVKVYKKFIQKLIDRGSITTDQFVIDSIRVLETFTWRMRKETEGYDYIFVDELQLFDPQERTALELLGRSRQGVPFITAEDPSQGVFSSLNARRLIDNEPVYLDVVHRFHGQIFSFISFLYRQFPLNALPLRIQEGKEEGERGAMLHEASNRSTAVELVLFLCKQLNDKCAPDARIAIVTLGDIDDEIGLSLTVSKFQVVQLKSFDDVEKLSYSKKSIVVSPWEFIGGTQFAHIIVVAVGISSPSSEFAKLREKVALYIACSRAIETLDIVVTDYVPPVVDEAVRQRYLAAAPVALAG